MRKELNLLKAGAYYEVKLLKNNPGVLALLVLRPYVALLLTYSLDRSGTLSSYFLQSLSLLASIDAVWDIAGLALLARWTGSLPYLSLTPSSLSSVLVLTYVPRYVIESLLKALALSPLLFLELAAPEALKIVLLSLFLVTLGLLPLLGFSMLVASATLAVKEDALWLEWVTPVLLLLAGVLYPVSLLPCWVRALSSAIPLTHLMEASAALLSGREGWAASLAAALALSAVHNAAGGLLSTHVERRLFKQGGLT
ncbi:MAG: hypothetical protein QXZ31_01225 [Thermofilaceae archaeon]